MYNEKVPKEENTVNEVVETIKDKMNKTMAVMKKDFASLRVGRANAQVLDRIQVDYYGTPTAINQLGNISIPEPRVLLISVWDTKAIKEVEKAIQKSDIGINPSNDGKVIRLVFPELTQERRKDLAKNVQKRAEEAKVAIRAIRRDANENIKKQKKNSDISEDDQNKLEDEVQKITDGFIKDVDKIASEKEKEIMEV